MVSLLRLMREETIAFRQLEGRSWETPAARAALERWEGIPVVADDLEDGFSLQHILEGEAACYVEASVDAAACSTDTTREELRRYGSFWSIGRMEPMYRKAIADVTMAVANGIPSAPSFRDIYPVLRQLTIWLLDVSQGYPPPSLAEAFGNDAIMCDPVVRYLVLVRSLNRLRETEFRELTVSLLNGDVCEAERILLTSCDFCYPSSHEIYQAWIAVLDRILAAEESWDNPLLQVRRDAIRYRLESGRAKASQRSSTAASRY